MHYWVYVHVCPNGKRYVGCTKQARPEYRWQKGKGYQNNDHFYRAILKYGWSNFQHEVFEVESEEEMYRKEVELISFYHSNDPRYGYNHSSGGEKSASGCIRSEEYVKNLSEACKERWTDPGFREKVSKAMKERWSDPEYREKMSEITEKKWLDPEIRRKISKALKGKEMSEETRRKISETLTGRTLSEEQRRKISETLKGRPGKPHSEEQRRKASESLKKKWSDPEYQKKMSKIRKGKSVSEEQRRKISETLKGRPQPRIKIKLPDETVIEITKQALTRYYINKGKKFEYVD